MPPEEAAAPVVVPPADQPPEPAAPKSFDERWKTAEAKAADEPGAPAPDKPGEPKPPAAKPAADPKDAKRAQLKQLAAELGLAVDDSAVSVAERAEFRAAKSRREAAIQAREEAAAKRERELEATHGEKYTRAEKIIKAWEDGDPDAFAAAVGTKDFNEFQEKFIRRLADPNYKELAELKKWQAEELQRKEEAEKSAQQQAAERQRAELRQAWMLDLAEKSKGSADKLAQAMGDDPMFQNVVFQIQSDHWDDDAQKTVTLEEAIDRGRKGSKTTLRQELKGLYERLHKAFGSEVAPPALAAKPSLNGKKPAPKTSVTPVSTVEGGSAPKKVGDMTEREWAEYKKKRFEEAGAD